MVIEYAGENRPQVGRRWLATALVGGVVATGVAAVVGYETGSLLHPDSVPGFAWRLHAGFKDETLRTSDAARHQGDPKATSPLPSMWKRAMIIGTPAAALFTHWANQPQSRLGVLYTDNDWHDGWAEPAQVYGAVRVKDNTAYLAAAVREGRNPAYVTWALSGEGDNWADTRLQLPTKKLGELAIVDLPDGLPLL